MTDAETRVYDSSREAAFDFARDLAKPNLRARLAEVGFDGAADVVVAYGPHETREQAAARVEGTGRRVLLAGADLGEACGWRMDWKEPV